MSAFAISLESLLYVKVQPIERLVDPRRAARVGEHALRLLPSQHSYQQFSVISECCGGPARPMDRGNSWPYIASGLTSSFTHLYLLELGELKPFENAVPWVGIYWR
jgi:hypothetical protein